MWYSYGKIQIIKKTKSVNQLRGKKKKYYHSKQEQRKLSLYLFLFKGLY